ncbi:MAG: tRNA lysidine(34) synthetase TilS [Gemmatimonas sp.]|nr:tRNA lysidine(34) synthetase TilS [Gemmatimonas sp.]
MPTQSEALESVHRSLAELPRGRWLLAVSGGRDSMALLDAFASARGHEVAGVASFDHGTGPAARKAVALVERTGLALQLPVMTGRMQPAVGHAKLAAHSVDEAAWREARWRFLDGWAAELRATVVTAHSWDDQVETVVLRLLRGSGPRGLAGMRVADATGNAEHAGASTRIARPFLTLRRDQIAAYATARRLQWVVDPSNATLAFGRNRVRHEILPALERASPGFAQWCWDLSGRAAAWRQTLATWVDAQLAPVLIDADRVAVRAAAMRTFDATGGAVIWPEVAARVGLAMDRRGIARVVAWAPTAKSGGRVQLSRGEVLCTASTFVIRRLY